jgi:hypothetical protein
VKFSFFLFVLFYLFFSKGGGGCLHSNVATMFCRGRLSPSYNFYSNFACNWHRSTNDKRTITSIYHRDDHKAIVSSLLSATSPSVPPHLPQHRFLPPPTNKHVATGWPSPAVVHHPESSGNPTPSLPHLALPAVHCSDLALSL